MMTPPRQRQRGVTLVEALIGFLILSLGLLGALRLQSWLRLNGDIAHQRTEAVRLAQQELEQLRAFTDVAAFDGIGDRQLVASGASTAFMLARSVTGAGSLLKTNRIAVNWPDRSGTVQSIHLQTSLAGISPVYSAALALAPQDTTLALRRKLPSGARWLGAGRSVVKPSRAGTVAWVVDNASGLITAQCSVIAARAAHEITEADLTACAPAAGTLLSGYVRFSLGGVPDAAAANDTPLALSVELVLDPAPRTTADAPHCETDIAPTFSTYTCLVPQPVSSNGWSGQVRLVADGWVFGDTAGTYKACRYGSDIDGSGRIDRNEEHPARYVDVRGPLKQQNYLVVLGEAACPGALPPHNDASVATVQHQP